MSERPLIALLTDFGTRDAYVGVMKGVMKSICADAEFIDLTHDIPPQDVRAAAFTLRNNYHYFPEHTVFLVVVDPGVGTARRAILWRSRRGYSFIAPDNGVLSYVLHNEPNTDDSVFAITRSPLPSPTSATFHGRDIFAPAAAMTAGNLLDTPEAETTFQPIAADTLLHLPAPRQEQTHTEISGEVLYIDHFGNLVTSIGHLLWQAGDRLAFTASFGTKAQERPIPQGVKITIGETQLPKINRTYGEVAVGDLLALVGSSGYLEISVNGGNAATRLGVKVGDTVTLHIPEGV